MEIAWGESSSCSTSSKTFTYCGINGTEVTKSSLVGENTTLPLSQMIPYAQSIGLSGRLAVSLEKKGNGEELALFVFPDISALCAVAECMVMTETNV